MKKNRLDPHEVLGVPIGASKEEIKKAYRALSKKHHPDKEGGNSEDFVKITEAYERLSNPYDKRNIAERRAEPAGFDPWFSFIVNQAAKANGRYERQLDIRLSTDIPVHLAFTGGEVEFEYIRNSYSGNKVHGERSKAKLKIPRRMANGLGVKMPGLGHKDGDQTGDLTVFIGYQCLGEKYLIDRAGNIKCRVEIPWEKTLSDDQVEICPFGTGEKVSVKLDSKAGILNSYILKNEGMNQYWGGAKQNGDLVIEVVSSLPLNMEERDRKSISEILKKYATL